MRPAVLSGFCEGGLHLYPNVRKARLAQQSRKALLVYHFMSGPDFTGGCPACSAIADGFNGFAIHLANHEVMLWAVSRAPLEKLQGYRRRMGWSFPWASSFGSDFNADFDVSLTEEQERAGVFEYNFRASPVWSPPQEMREPPSPHPRPVDQGIKGCPDPLVEL